MEGFRHDSRWRKIRGGLWLSRPRLVLAFADSQRRRLGILAAVEFKRTCQVIKFKNYR